MRTAGHNYYTHDWGATRLTAGGGWACRWLHFGRRGAAWVCCCGDGMNSPFLRMSKEHFYAFRLSVMLGCIQRDIANGDLSQPLVIPHISHCCLDAPFGRGWFRVSRFHWKTTFDFDHGVCDRDPLEIFAGWHNVETYAISLSNCERYYVHQTQLSVPVWRPTVCC